MEELLLDLIPKFLDFISGLIPDFTEEIPALDFFWDVLVIVAWILPMKTVATIIGIVLAFCSLKLILTLVRLIVEIVGAFV
jgi:hypothetical protein